MTFFDGFDWFDGGCLPLLQLPCFGEFAAVKLALVVTFSLHLAHVVTL